MFAIISLLSKNSLRDLLSNPASALRNSPLCSIPALGLPIAIICPLLSHKKMLFVVMALSRPKKGLQLFCQFD